MLYTKQVLSERETKQSNKAKDDGLSPNGKALDSDSSISRFESL